MKKAICLLSGGLDSTVTSFIAKQQGYDIFPMSFLYGQQHDKELKAAQIMAKSLSEHDHIIFHLNLSQFGGSSLYKTTRESIPMNMDIATIGKEIPSTYVPARNTIFLSIALSYAETLEADAIFIGVTAADYSGYPDCRPEYIEAFQKVVNLATKQAMMNHTIHVEAPLLLLSKAQIITYGKKLQVPFEHTWSCYSGQSKACGKCDSCLLRLKGFQESGIRDPLLYETTPHWYTLNND